MPNPFEENPTWYNLAKVLNCTSEHIKTTDILCSRAYTSAKQLVEQQPLFCACEIELSWQPWEPHRFNLSFLKPWGPFVGTWAFCSGRTPCWNAARMDWVVSSKISGWRFRRFRRFHHRVTPNFPHNCWWHLVTRCHTFKVSQGVTRIPEQQSLGTLELGRLLWGVILHKFPDRLKQTFTKFDQTSMKFLWFSMFIVCLYSMYVLAIAMGQKWPIWTLSVGTRGRHPCSLFSELFLAIGSIGLLTLARHLTSNLEAGFWTTFTAIAVIATDMIRRHGTGWFNLWCRWSRFFPAPWVCVRHEFVVKGSDSSHLMQTMPIWTCQKHSHPQYIYIHYYIYTLYIYNIYIFIIFAFMVYTHDAHHGCNFCAFRWDTRFWSWTSCYEVHVGAFAGPGGTCGGAWRALSGVSLGRGLD